QFVLRDLVALGQVRIKIIFAREARVLVHSAVDGQSGAHGHFNGALVENGQRAGKTEADGADVGVRRIAETRGAAAENFRFGEELDVDFQADDRLVFGKELGRHGGFGGEFRHGERNKV